MGVMGLNEERFNVKMLYYASRAKTVQEGPDGLSTPLDRVDCSVGSSSKTECIQKLLISRSTERTPIQVERPL